MTPPTTEPKAIPELKPAILSPEATGIASGT
ncbi:hypothetical protein Xekk_01434 [Xenorhabdus sp. KK7.4]|nr:hypothetical protein Xekk_01434 [Xenorhabdus sp. KK7.4]